MDGREGIALSGSAPYYLHRVGGISGSSSVHTGFNAQHGHTNLSNPNFHVQPIVRGNANNHVDPSFNVEESSGAADFSQGFTVGMASGGSLSEGSKKKRGRPRKYGPDGAGPRSLSGLAAMSLALSPMSSPSSLAPADKQKKGRPPGSGWKQRLSSVGEWMSSSAGTAFTPHVIHVSPGEDIAEKILLFAQQRPRSICMMSASGGVSSVTLRRPGNSNETFTHEGCFEILSISGSYLVDENNGGHGRTGGVTCSLSGTDGSVIGGPVGGSFVASRHVQVVVCSFVYGSSKPKVKSDSNTKPAKKSRLKQTDRGPEPENVSPCQMFSPALIW